MFSTWFLEEDDDEFFDCEDPDSTDADNEQQTSPSDLLYEGAECTVGMCLTMILTFIMAHGLSKHCLNHLLAMLKLLLPKGNKLVTSVKKFFDFFSEFQSSTRKHYFCQFCTEALNSVDQICPRCGPGKGTSFFIQMSIKEQLQKLFERPGFVENLSYPQTRTKQNNDAYEDIIDGAIYKEAMRILLDNGRWITFLWSTDGLALFRSSNFEIWPFFLAINELPPHLRYRRENLILAGVLFGKGSFDANLYLKPIYEELEELKRGVALHVPNEPDPVIFKAGCLCGTCDTPAKSKFINHKAFNGLWGCPKCLIRGEKSAATEKVFVYPFQEDLPLRSDENYKQHLAVVRQTGKEYMGIQGPSFIQLMLLISMVRSTSVDVMHAVFQGVMKYLLHLWFDKKHKDEPFSLYAHTAVVNEYLCSIKPPHFLQRAPQSLDKLSYWKASEFESFLFYYSLPIFSKIMPQTMFNHFKLFYHGLVLLYQNSITAPNIQLSQSLLDEFCRQFADFYALRFMTFNLHMLRHLPGVVLELGPLWATSCFAFEDMIGCLKQMVHGTQHTALQVKSTFELVSRVSVIFERLTSGAYKDLCRKMFDKFSRLKLSICISPNTYVVGSILRNLQINDITDTAISTVRGNIFFFNRLKKSDILYIASCNTKGNKNSSVAVYDENDSQKIGVIQTFLRVSQCMCENLCDCDSEYKAVIQRFHSMTEFHTLEPPSQISFVLTCNLSNNIDIVPIETLCNVCVLCSVENKEYVVPILNNPNCQ